MFQVSLTCKAAEPKIVRTLERWSKNFPFQYKVNSAGDSINVEFSVKNLAARNELLRRLRHIKGFDLLEICTERG